MSKLETNDEIEAYLQKKYAELSPPLRALMDAEEENGVTAIAYTFARTFSEHIIACVEKNNGRPMTAGEKLDKISRCVQSAAAMIVRAEDVVQVSLVPIEDAQSELEDLKGRLSK